MVPIKAFRKHGAEQRLFPFMPAIVNDVKGPGAFHNTNPVLSLREG
jgi:hypothetical protein